ncbi:hypothetical protein EJB05_52070, partial [Eragrostis curvula]
MAAIPSPVELRLIPSCVLPVPVRDSPSSPFPAARRPMEAGQRPPNPSKQEAFFNSSSPACLLCAEVDGCVLNIWLNQEAPDERFQRLGGIQAP